MKYLAAVLALPVLALAAQTDPDTHFYKAAAAGGIGEVEMGRIAEQKSSDPKVKEFAAMMIKDHSAANEELKSLAASKSVSLPDGPGAHADAAKAKLQLLSGASFDKYYLSNQIAAHKSTVALLNKEISSGQDDEAKAFARKILPTVRSHLKAADQLAESLGIKH